MYLCTHIHVWALSDFDGDFAPEFGTEDSPADYCARNSSLSPNHTYIGSKDAGTELFWAKILKVDFAEEFPKKKSWLYCAVPMMKNEKYLFFSKIKVEMNALLYGKRDQMIMMPLF